MTRPTRLRDALVLWGLALLHPPLTVQGQVATHVYAGGGLSMIFSPHHLYEQYKPGLNLGVDVAFRFPSRIEPFVDVDFTRFSLDEDNFLGSNGLSPGEVDVEGAVLSTAGVSAGVRLHIGAKKQTTYYLILQGGVHRRFATVVDVQGGGAEMERSMEARLERDVMDGLGLGAGAGIIYHLGARTGVFMEAAYDVAFFDDDALQRLPVRLGIVFIDFGF